MYGTVSAVHYTGWVVLALPRVIRCNTMYSHISAVLSVFDGTVERLLGTVHYTQGVLTHLDGGYGEGRAMNGTLGGGIPP